MKLLLSIALLVLGCGDYCQVGDTRCAGGTYQLCLLDSVDTTCNGDGEYMSCSSINTGHWSSQGPCR